jgi:hypothetical protein
MSNTHIANGDLKLEQIFAEMGETHSTWPVAAGGK